MKKTCNKCRAYKSGGNCMLGYLIEKLYYDGIGSPVFGAKPKEKPKQIEFDEWLYKGCFIQNQSHSNLKLYHVFKDTEQQDTVDTCFTFNEAKKLCVLNEVKDYKHGYKAFL